MHVFLKSASNNAIKNEGLCKERSVLLIFWRLWNSIVIIWSIQMQSGPFLSYKLSLHASLAMIGRLGVENICVRLTDRHAHGHYVYLNIDIYVCIYIYVYR